MVAFENRFDELIGRKIIKISLKSCKRDGVIPEFFYGNSNRDRC